LLRNGCHGVAEILRIQLGMMTILQDSFLSRNPLGSVERPLPEGVRDLLFADAAAWRDLEAALRTTWRQWGYRELILPTFEYASTLATDVGAEIDAEMYRFFDRHGRTLALRPDMTIPTARVVGTRLYDQPLPLRIAYAGSVFRYEPPRAGHQHEFTQAGIELIGAPTRAADAEAVALAVAALAAAGLPSFRITVGHVGFFRGLLAALDLPPRTAARVRDAVNRKAEAELEGLLDEAGAGLHSSHEALIALPLLSGGPEVFPTARRYAVHPAMHAALDELEAIATLLTSADVGHCVDYDLSEVRDLDYYTGVTFEGFAPGLGFNLVSGGRYDELVGHFGPSMPAVGWALTLDRLVLARAMQGVTHPDPAAHILLAGEPADSSLPWAMAARARGVSVEMDLLGLAPELLWAAARARGVHRSACWVDAKHLDVWEPSGRRLIRADDWTEVAQWRLHR
jgi:ATP phosphoribosyltransferase regulatory subunit